MQVKIKRCSACKKEKYISEFYKGGGSFKGIRSVCKFCQSIQAVKRQKKRSKKVFTEKCREFVAQLEKLNFPEKSTDEKLIIFYEIMVRNRMGFRKYTPNWNE